MNEDVYVLKHEINDFALYELNYQDNFGNDRLFNAIEKDRNASLDEIEDWISAIKSNKKIVNPMSPEEELSAYVKELGQLPIIWNPRGAAKKIVDLIAKAYPDIKDWIKEKNEKL